MIIICLSLNVLTIDILSSYKLRFKCGDKVSCQIGDQEWQSGVIVQLLYKQLGQKFPYQIRLNVDGALICAPVDDDSCIKAATKEFKLRFKSGDRVACRCGEWKHGTVIHTWWYDTIQGVSQPYQVKLDEGYLVFAPKDSDNCIQKSLPNVDPNKNSDVIPSSSSSLTTAGQFQSAMPSIPGGNNQSSSQKEESIEMKIKRYTTQLRTMGITDIDSTEELRFKIGDRVQCQTEAWEPGIIIKLWYEEDDDIYPYQIRLDTKSLIYAPIDTDVYIKEASTKEHPFPADLFVDENDPLFHEPTVKEKNCPICFLPISDHQSIFQPCCGESLCSGCIQAASTFVDADIHDGYKRAIREVPCPFCRQPGAKNGKEIITRLRRRVENHDPMAATTLAGFYHSGQHGLQINYKMSFELYKLAEELGSTEAYSSLGWAYWKGEGVKRDMEKTRHYLELAAMKGNVHARGNLAWIEFDEGNPWKAYKHYVISAKFGLSDAMHKVREGYTQGFVSKEEFSDVLRSFQKLMLEKASESKDKALVKHEA